MVRYPTQIIMANRILIVDDTKFMRKMLRKILSVKYNVIGEAENGREAFNMVQEHDPDLVTLDVVMPKMDGFEALSKIKDNDASQKVIMCTSVDQHEKVIEAMKRGADGYIVKPFKKESVLEEIEKVLGE